MDREPSYGLSQLSAVNTEAMEVLLPLGSSDEQASPSLEPLDERYGIFRLTLKFFRATSVYPSAFRTSHRRFFFFFFFFFNGRFLDELRKFVMLLAILAACVTYQADLNPPGGFWVDTASEHSRNQEAERCAMEGESRIFSCTAAIALVCPFGAQAGSLTLFLRAVIIWVVFIEFLYIIMSKAQADRNLASASEDSEFPYMGSYTETEPENSSCSDSMAAIIAVDETPAIWLVGSAFTHHATGNRKLVSNFETVDDLNIQTGDGVHMPFRGRGCVITDTLVLPDVLFVPGLKMNIVSVSQLAQLGCSIVFKHDACYISTATDGTTIGKALVGENGMFKLEFLKVPLVN